MRKADEEAEGGNGETEQELRRKNLVGNGRKDCRVLAAENLVQYCILVVLFGNSSGQL
jgi:hypothetical protein